MDFIQLLSPLFSRNFRVIALAVPNPPYSSLARSIDPPLRSRFQVRRIDPLPPSELLTMFHQQDLTTKLATLVGSIDDASSRDFQVSPFPSHALETINDSCGDIEFFRTFYIPIQ